MTWRRAWPPSGRSRARRIAWGETLIEVLLALWLVAALALELVRVEVQQVRLRQALDLRLRAAAVLDTFAETRHAVGAAHGGGGEALAAIDWAARVADALPEGRIAANAIGGGAIRVEVNWRHARGRERPVPVGPMPGAGMTAACVAAAGTSRDCLAIILADRPAIDRPAIDRPATDRPATDRSAIDPLARLPGSAAFASPVPPAAASKSFLLSPSGFPLSRGKRRVAGHSLLELLIAAVLGAMTVTAALSVYQVRRDSQARRIDDARMRMDGQAAVDLLRAHARLAGYGLSFAAGTARSLPAVLNCPADAWRKSSCLRANPGSDGLVIHYRADAVSASMDAGMVALLDCGGRLLPGRGTVTAARVAVLKGRDGEPPRLHCRGQGQGGSDPFVEGAERLQIRYWLAGPRGPLAASAVGDSGLAIRAVEFCVTVRGHMRLPRRGAAAPGAYRDCEGRWQPAAPDGYARRTFTVTVALRNFGDVAGEAAAGVQGVQRVARRAARAAGHGTERRS
ncbi:MAG: hypothetical protein ACRYGL_07075 [Janthinobacterium lividum]